MKPTAKLGKLLKLWALFFIFDFLIGFLNDTIMIHIGFILSILAAPELIPRFLSIYVIFKAHTGFCIISLIYVHLHEKQGIKSLIKPLANFQRLSISTILAQLLVLFALMLWISIQEELWHPIVVQPVVHFGNIVHFLLFGVLQVTCLAAIGEELFFRHILEKLLYAITGRKLLSTIITSLLFSLLHGNIQYSLIYFILGCFFSYLYQKSGHIVYPIMAHAINNLCVVSIIYILGCFLELDGIIGSAIKSLPIIVRSMVAIGSLLAAYFCITYGYLAIDKNNKT